MSKAATLSGPAGEAAVLMEIDHLQLEIARSLKRIRTNHAEIARLRKETRARLERIKRS